MITIDIQKGTENYGVKICIVRKRNNHFDERGICELFVGKQKLAYALVV